MKQRVEIEDVVVEVEDKHLTFHIPSSMNGEKLEAFKQRNKEQLDKLKKDEDNN